MKRLTVMLLVAVAATAGCGGGGGEGGAPAPVVAEPAVAATPEPASTGPTEEQLAVREQLLADIASGEYKCHCNSALRARERIESGLVKPPPRDAYVSEP